MPVSQLPPEHRLFIWGCLIDPKKARDFQAKYRLVSAESADKHRHNIFGLINRYSKLRITLELLVSVSGLSHDLVARSLGQMVDDGTLTKEMNGNIAYYSVNPETPVARPAAVANVIENAPTQSDVPANVYLSQEQRAVLAAIRDIPSREATVAKLSKVTELPERAVRSILKILVSDRLVQVIGTAPDPSFVSTAMR